MNLNEMLTPPGIVREVEDDAKIEAEKWDAAAQENEKNRCRSMLSFSEALYNLEKDEGYKLLGFNSIYEYVYKRFSRSKASTKSTINVYKKYVIELGVDMEQLIEVGIGKLSKMVAHVDEDNIDETLEDMKEMSQKDIDEKIKEKDGLAPNQTREEDTVEGQKQSSLKFKAPEEMIDTIKSGLAIASDTIANLSTYYSTGKDVPPAAALEYIVADWLTGADYDGKAYVNLERALELLERTYKIQISYQDAEEIE